MSLRIDFADGKRLGPGKVKLLEAIAEHGSISAAGRAIGMSYKRAWDLIEEMNSIFGAPVIASKTGGQKGGGATLTDLGAEIIECYRRIEHKAGQAAEQDLAVLRKAIKPE